MFAWVRHASWSYLLCVGMAAFFLLSMVGLGWYVYSSGEKDMHAAMGDGRVVILELGVQDEQVAHAPEKPEPEKPATEPGAAPVSAEGTPPEQTSPTDQAEAPAPSTDPSAATEPAALVEEALPEEPPEQTPDAASPSLTPVAGQALPSSPAEGMAEQTDLGPLPKIGSGNRAPWQIYARPFDEKKASGPVIAILVTGLGLSKEVTEEALKMPPDITVSINPYAPQATNWATSARALGHETLLELPVEPLSYPDIDPGPYALLSMNSPEENEKRLRWLLTRTSGYIGVYVPPGERFTGTLEVATPAFEWMNARGLITVFGRETSLESQEKVMAQSGMPFLRVTFRLDDVLTGEAIEQQLAALENAAVRKGFALGVAGPYPLSLRVISRWMEAAEKKGIIIAPVSVLARKKFS